MRLKTRTSDIKLFNNGQRLALSQSKPDAALKFIFKKSEGKEKALSSPASLRLCNFYLYKACWLA